jgi:hypothetical protein
MSKENPSTRQSPVSPHGDGHRESCAPELAQRARDIVSGHPQFRGRANGFTFARRGDTLIVRGTVPTYYLKQLLQTALKDLEGIQRIDNQVVVAAPHGTNGSGHEHF